MIETMPRAFSELLRKVVTAFTHSAPQKVILLHHNDSDGLSSGTILSATFERLGIRLLRYCLEKPYPLALERIFEESNEQNDTAVVLADFGSGMIPTLARINANRFPVFIIDHHTILESEDKKIHLVNPRVTGVSGDSDCSASTASFFFANALTAHATDLAPLAALGALGDRQIGRDGRLMGLNAIAAAIAEQQKMLNFNQEYFLRLGDEISAFTLTSLVDALGSFDYFGGGPDVAMKGLRDHCVQCFTARAENLRNRFEDLCRTFFKETPLQQGNKIQWCALDERFSGMGVKTVGLVCEWLARSPYIEEDKYIAGFQRIPPKIPGLGSMPINESKISMRLPPPLAEKVKNGAAPSLVDFLPQATRSLDGFVDACHHLAGATTIPRGKEAVLIAEMERLLAHK